MSTLSDFQAALTADVDEVQVVIDAQDALSAAAITAATKVAELSAAQAVLVAANSAVVDPENVTTEEQVAIDAAQAIVTTKTTAKEAAEAAVITARDVLAAAEAGVDAAAAQAIAAKLSITDFCMVSNDQAKIYIMGQGKPVLFQEPENVRSDFWMQPIVE